MKNKELYQSEKGWRNFLRSKKRKETFRLLKARHRRHEITMKKNAEIKKMSPLKRSISPPYKSKLPRKPDYPININYLLSLPQFFSNAKLTSNTNGYLKIPKCFSLIENYEESFNLLKQLFIVLHKRNSEGIILDYKDCERIDVDASICMDIMLAEFISHFEKCRRLGYQNIFPNGIQPINFEKEAIKKVLFSIGAYRNIRGFNIKYPDIIDLPVIINNHTSSNVWSQSEINLTKVVEYIKNCLKRLNRELTSNAENELYKVVGEIMSNSLEHGTMPHSFVIGFFQETHNESEHFGIFNFSIFNFGDTIYQTFKNPNCPNTHVVEQMTLLSNDYTKKGWFKKAAFEEETLWTLYALQEGVTSKKAKRGNGSIQYIENFFRLKGDLTTDNISRLVVVSGNTRILFDGTYNITEKPRNNNKGNYKVMTFNNSKNISELPDKNFVTFAPHFFPGTLISARILIKFDNTNAQANGYQHI